MSPIAFHFISLFLATQIASASFFPPNFSCLNFLKDLFDRGAPAVKTQALDLNKQVSYRGFLGDRFADTPEFREAKQKYGIIQWRQPIYVVPSLAEAKAHLALERNLLMMPIYIIAPHVNLAHAFGNRFASQIDKAEAQKVFADLMQRRDLQMWQPKAGLDLKDYDDGDALLGVTREDYLAALSSAGGNKLLTQAEQLKVQRSLYAAKNLRAPTELELTPISRELAHWLFEPSKIVLVDDFQRTEVFSDGTHGRNEKFFYHPGWAMPAFGAGISRNNAQNPKMIDGVSVGSTTYQKISRYIRGLSEKGYLVTVNGGTPENFPKTVDDIFELLSIQERRATHILSGEAVEMDPATNRYGPEEAPKRKKEWLDEYSHGRSFSVEVWSPALSKTGKRILLGASVGERLGELLTPDTVAYNRLFVDALQILTSPNSSDAESGIIARIKRLTPSQQEISFKRLAEYKDFIREYAESESMPVAQARDLFLKVIGVDYAKMTMLATVMMLAKNGITFLDTGMVTDLTETLQAKYMPRSKYFNEYRAQYGSMEPKSLVGPSIWSYQDSPDWAALSPNERGQILKALEKNRAAAAAKKNQIQVNN